MLLIMEDVMKNNRLSMWHLIAGILMVVLGFFIWFHPENSLVALAVYIGFVFVVIGSLYVATSFSFISGWYMVVGILDIIVGAFLLTNIAATVVALPVVFALWCLAVGGTQLFTTWELKKINWPWKWSALAGVLGIIFGFVLLAYPLFSAAVIVTIMGMYFVSYGAVEILEYLYVRKLDF